MTHYPGGKKRTGEEIAEKIYLSAVGCGKKIRGYCEPFCGMLGVYQHIPSLFEEGIDGEGPSEKSHSKLKYLAGDRDPTVICMWEAAQRGWKPPRRCTEAKFYRLKKTKDKVTPEKAFLGRANAFRGTYFNTYDDRINLISQAENVEELAEELYDVRFTAGEYTQFSHLSDYVIYCDPPYKSTQHNYASRNGKLDTIFDYEKFYIWCNRMSENNIVFISEFYMPKDFERIWIKGKEKLYLKRK